MDMTAKEILSVWESFKEMMVMSDHKEGELKIKAYKTWGEIA